MLFVTSSYEFLKIYIGLDFGKFYLFAFFEVLCEKFRDVAQPGSAHVWGAWGRKFESCHPDKIDFFQIECDRRINKTFKNESGWLDR